jgi:hypothetical protein
MKMTRGGYEHNHRLSLHQLNRANWDERLFPKPFLWLYLPGCVER